MHGGQPKKCSNLEQTTPEMGEPELSATELLYQITLQFGVNLTNLKYDCSVTDSAPISISTPGNKYFDEQRLFALISRNTRF